MKGLRIDHVTKRYGEVVALDDFSLDVAPGEFMAVVGPSGAGKTTLLRVIAGLEKHEAGNIYLDDVLVNDIPVGRRDVQMIFQTLALWPHLRVLDEENYSNISFPLKIRQWTKAQIAERVHEIAARVRLDRGLFHRKPDELSGGERQRVALARAMTTNPSVFLMDEPLSSLDPLSRMEMRKEIRRLHEETGAVTIYVTHNMADASTMADRIAIMRDGKLLQVGTHDILLRQPIEPFVTEFLNTY